MFEPDKITRSGGPSNGSAQKGTPLREASKALIQRGKMWVIARVLTPPVLVASVYGMNFERMPELAWPYGYAWA